jgi:signal transduction histidine kinase
VGTAAGPAAFERGEFVQAPALRESLRAPILAIGEDRSRLFFATDRGVYVYTGGKLSELTQDGTSIRGVDAFFLDRDGLVWMGTVGFGLRLLEGNRVTSFLTRNGLFDNEIYGIVRDNDDRLWMACSKGIFSVPRTELRRFAAGELKKITSNPYTPTDALRVIESKPGVQPVISIMRDGRLWFSTIRGLLALEPNRQPRNVPPLPVVIEEVIVNGENQSPNLIRRLAPGQKNLEFRYTGLSFRLPGRTTFKYMLEGYDHTWIEAGARREAFYTNLPPGDFRFRVTACTFDGTCNERGSYVAFVLAPYFYQKSWFLPLCAALLGLAAWLVYQLRIRRLREHFGLILAERNRIARELHDTLMQGFSGITMEMQALAARLRSPEEHSTLMDIIRDAGNCLRETRRSVGGLRSAPAGGPQTGLSAAIAHAAQQITEAKDIRLRLKLGSAPKGLAEDVEYNLLRIAQEAVSNSVKHSGARTVEVALSCTPELVSLSVKDDGSGFAREGNGSGRPGHYGLIGMKERATQIGADLRLASEPGRGTTVSVVLPCAPDAR